MSNHPDSQDRPILGPHQAIPTSDAREQFTAELFDVLWNRYRQRVEHVRTYETLVRKAGATFVNDHIALRTFGCQMPATGIVSLSRIFEAIGYRAAGCYVFPQTHLNAIHYQHPNRMFPKVFISELKTWELEATVREPILRTLQTHRPLFSDEKLATLLSVGELDANERTELLDAVVSQFHESPWALPEKNDVLTLNEESQYAAWVLVHGYNVNHFTSLINSHEVESLDDIEKTMSRLKEAGVPTKESIEGEPGSVLRQSATTAVMIDVEVSENGKHSRIPWTYAYFELAERGEVIDPAGGQQVRFEGFLGPQATQLFEMTSVKK